MNIKRIEYLLQVAEQGSFSRAAAVLGPDGHPKLLHLWPVKLLQAGRGDYGDSVVMAMREAASFSR